VFPSMTMMVAGMPVAPDDVLELARLVAPINPG
jgi:hypothetical protein